MAISDIGVSVQVMADSSADAKKLFQDTVQKMVSNIKPAITVTLDEKTTKQSIMAQLDNIFKDIGLSVNASNSLSNQVANAVKSGMEKGSKSATSSSKSNLASEAKQAVAQYKELYKQREALRNQKSNAGYGGDIVSLVYGKDAKAKIEDIGNSIKSLNGQISGKGRSNLIKDSGIKDILESGAKVEITASQFANLRKEVVSLNEATLNQTSLSQDPAAFAANEAAIERSRSKVLEYLSTYKLTKDQVADLNSSIAASTQSASNVVVKTLGDDITKVSSFQKQLTSFEGQFEKWAINNSKAVNSGKYTKDINNIRNSFETLSNEFVNLDPKQAVQRLNELSTSFRNLQNRVTEAGDSGKAFSDKVGTMIEKFGGWTLVTRSLTAAIHRIKELYTNVVEIDTAMTELKKVTDETADTYNKFLSDAGVRAQELGATMTEVINATADIARLGYNIADASGIANAILLYNNVGDGLEDISEASNSVISTMQAFKGEWNSANQTASEASLSIVDKFNAVGNAYAISSGGVGEALERSAASLYAANNTLDESIALAAAMNTTIQDPQKVGTTLKTVSMYLRAAKTEAEEAGIETDGMATSVSKLRGEIQALTGVDIMATNDEFKSTYQIFKELSSVWGTLSDVTQANITEKLGGKRNANAVSALLEDFSIAENALETSANSAGSAMAENEKYLDSIRGRLDQLKAAWQNFSTSVLNSELVKFAVSGLTDILKVLNALIDKLPVLAAAIAGIGLVKLSPALAANSPSWLSGIFVSISKLNGVVPTASKYLKILSLQFNTLKNYGMGTGEAIKTLTSNTWSMIPAAAKAGLAIAALAIAIQAASYAANSSSRQSEKDAAALQEVDNEISNIQAQIAENESKITAAKENFISVDDSKVINQLTSQNDLLKTQLAYYESIRGEREEAARESAANDFLKGKWGGGEKLSGAEALLGTNFETAFNKSASEYYINQTGLSNASNNQFINQKSIDSMKEAMETARNEMGLYKNAAVGTLAEMGEYTDQWSDKQKSAYMQAAETVYKYYMTIGESGNAYVSLANMVGISSQAIKSAGTVDELQAIIEANNGLMYALEGLGITSKEFANDLFRGSQESDIFADSLNNIEDAAQNAAAELESLNGALDSLQSQYKLLQTAQDEFNNSGLITIDTLQDMINEFPQLTDLVIDYMNGNISAQDVIAGYKDVYENDNALWSKLLENKAIAQQAYSNWLNSAAGSLFVENMRNAYGVDLRNCASAEEAKKQIREKLLSAYYDTYNKYQTAELAQLKQRSAVLRGYIHSYRREGRDTSGYQAELDAVNAAISAFSQIQTGITTAAQYSFAGFAAQDYKTSNTSTSSTSKSSVKNEAFDKELDALKHNLEMEYISEAQYYDSLEKLYQKYFSRGSEDWNKYEEEVYKGRKRLLEEEQREQEKLMEEAKKNIDDLLDVVLDAIKQAKEDEIDALEDQIDAYEDIADVRKKALKDLQNEAEYTKTVAEKRKLVADLENRLASAKLDTSAQGVKRQIELEQELQDARTELQEYEYDHSIELQEAQIDAELEAERAKVQSQIDILQEYLDNQNALVTDAWKTINGMSNDLYQSLIDWNVKYGTGIESDITNKWNAAAKALEDYGSKYKALETYQKLAEATGTTYNVGSGTSTGGSGTTSTPAKTTTTTTTTPAPAPAPAPAKSNATTTKTADDATAWGVAAAIWCHGNAAGWGNGDDRKNKLVSKFGTSGQTKIQGLLNSAGNGSVYNYWANTLKYDATKFYYNKFASGKRSVPLSGNYLTQEKGTEAIMHNGGLITPLSGGDAVFNNAATQRLWELANSPDSNWLVSGVAKSAANIIERGASVARGINGGMSLNVSFGDMIINGNADEGTLNKFRKDIVNDVMSAMNQVYTKKGYTTNPRSAY